MIELSAVKEKRRIGWAGTVRVRSRKQRILFKGKGLFLSFSAAVHPLSPKLALIDPAKPIIDSPRFAAGRFIMEG
jgi:hypothetical protein